MPIDRPDPGDAPDGPAVPDTPRPRGMPSRPPDTADHDAYRARVERSYAKETVPSRPNRIRRPRVLADKESAGPSGMRHLEA